MSAEYVLMTDSSCDLPYDFYEKNGISVTDLSFIIDGESRFGREVTPKEFYDLLRAGKTPSTSAVNVEDAKTMMEPHLKEGKDVLYLAFSSGLSVTAQNGMEAARELRENYPDRKIIVIDSLCASLGQGLMLYHANRFWKEGMAIDELAAWITDHRLNMVHYVMADDLMHLHRGGRISKASAIAGAMLGIKPIIHMNDEGKLVAIGKVRGKKQALTDLVDRVQKAVGNTKNDFFTVSHADCEEDAKFVAELVSKRLGIKKYMINFIEPVIGSHTGPGTVALFILAEHR